MSARERLRDVGGRARVAAELAREGDPAALPALVDAYDDRVETGGDALLDAMHALGGAAAARRLAGSEDAGERRTAARLMSLIPEPENLPALEPLLTDAAPEVAAAARSALRHQWRTPEWRAAVERLAGSPDPELREAARSLGG